MAERRLFLVVGSESSGTRMLAGAFIAAGCFGDAGHDQRLDSAVFGSLKAGDWPAVLRRSYPHGLAWPILDRYQALLRERFQAETTVVAIWRERDFVVWSKVARGFGKLAAIEREVDQARSILREQFESYNGPKITTNYEEFVACGDERRRVFESCGFEVPRLQLYDANLKHRAGR